MAKEFAQDVWQEAGIAVSQPAAQADHVTSWNWELFNEKRPALQVCIRETKKAKQPVYREATYTVVERNGAQWVDVEFRWQSSRLCIYMFSISQHEIGSCLNAPERYQPALPQWIKDAFYSIAFRLAQ